MVDYAAVDYAAVDYAVLDYAIANRLDYPVQRERTLRVGQEKELLSLLGQKQKENALD